MDIAAAYDAWRQGKPDHLINSITTNRAAGPEVLAQSVCALLDLPSGDAILEELVSQNVLVSRDLEESIKFVSSNAAITLSMVALKSGCHCSEFYKLVIFALSKAELFGDAGILLSVALIDYQFSAIDVLPALESIDANRLGVALAEHCIKPTANIALRIADVLCQLGCHSSARRLLADILARGERQQDVWQKLHHLQSLECATPQEVIAELQHILAGDPDNAAIAHALSGTMLALGRYDDAIALLQQAVDLSPHAAYLWFNLGYSQTFRRFDRADNMRAIAAFERAAALGYDVAAVWGNLASLYCEIGDAEKARKALGSLPPQMLISWWPRSSPWPDPTGGMVSG